MQKFIQSLKTWFTQGLKQPDVLSLVFVKWTDESRQKLYHDDVHFMLNSSDREPERQQDASYIDWPSGIVWMDVKTGPGFQKMTKGESVVWKKSKRGTPPGSTLKVTFLPTEDAASRKDEVLSYLKRVGAEFI